MAIKQKVVSLQVWAAPCPELWLRQEENERHRQVQLRWDAHRIAVLKRSINPPPDAVCWNNYLLFVLRVCGTSGEYLLFCKGADSSIFPRVVSGKVEQVKARVEQNAVVSVQFECSLISSCVIWLKEYCKSKAYWIDSVTPSWLKCLNLARHWVGISVSYVKLEFSLSSRSIRQ